MFLIYKHAKLKEGLVRCHGCQFIQRGGIHSIVKVTSRICAIAFIQMAKCRNNRIHACIHFKQGPTVKKYQKFKFSPCTTFFKFFSPESTHHQKNFYEKCCDLHKPRSLFLQIFWNLHFCIPPVPFVREVYLLIMRSMWHRFRNPRCRVVQIKKDK